MASNALNPAYRRMSVREFLAMNIGDAKAELVDGQVMMKAYGSVHHAAIIGNLIGALAVRLRAIGCRPYGSDLALRTGEHTVRFPDISVYCRDDNPPVADDAQLLGVPRVVFEVLSPSTASNDQVAKLAEYCALPGLHAIVFVDPAMERVRLVLTCDDSDSGWLAAGSDLVLAGLGISLPHAEIFE